MDDTDTDTLRPLPTAAASTTSPPVSPPPAPPRPSRSASRNSISSPSGSPAKHNNNNDTPLRSTERHPSDPSLASAVKPSFPRSVSSQRTVSSTSNVVPLAFGSNVPSVGFNAAMERRSASQNSFHTARPSPTRKHKSSTGSSSTSSPHAAGASGYKGVSYLNAAHSDASEPPSPIDARGPMYTSSTAKDNSSNSLNNSIPRSQGMNGLNLSSRSLELSRSTSSSGSQLSAGGRRLSNHALSLSKIPIAAASMSKTLSASSYDVSRSPALPEDDLFAESPNYSEHHPYAQPYRNPTSSSTAKLTNNSSMPPPSTTTSVSNSNMVARPMSRNSSSARSSRTNSFSSANGTHLPRRAPTPSSQPMSHNRSNGGGGGVFYGSSSDAGSKHAARVASAASGTGKVLSELQVELATTRGALETTKNQLRISQRAVEHLSRQVGDLSDGRERLKLENEGLNKILARKERMLEETLQRARASEALHSNFKTQIQDHVKKNKDMEKSWNSANEKMHRAESEYTALKNGVKSMHKQWRRDLEGVRETLAEIQRQHEKELQETRIKHKSLIAITQNRSSHQNDIATLVAHMESLQQSYHSEYTSAVSKLSRQIQDQDQLNRSSSSQAQTVADDLLRMRRLMRDHARGRSTPTGRATPTTPGTPRQ